MTITDKYVLHQLKIVNSCELEEMLNCYPENERDERSDVQMLADEAGYLLSMFNEDGTCHNDDLNDAKELLYETKYGKEIPLHPKTLKPCYRPSEVQTAKDIVNEYRRLGSLMTRLRRKGIYSKW